MLVLTVEVHKLENGSYHCEVVRADKIRNMMSALVALNHTVQAMIGMLTFKGGRLGAANRRASSGNTPVKIEYEGTAVWEE